MSKFNSKGYLKDQIEKQYSKDIMTIHKNVLNFDPFNEALSKLCKDQYEKIQSIVDNHSIESIQESIKNNEFTYVDLLLYYLKKIKTEDHLYNSVIFLNPLALLEAKDKTYDDSHHPIYGMPILVKGNIGVKGLPLSAGSAALKKNIAMRDSQLIESLKEKGAVILGQTNLSEFANYMTANSSNGYSAIGGQTKNPYGKFDVGGSSAGSAVAMTKGFAVATIGTETAGSIIYPSSQNGVIGLKPTLGTVSQDLIVPISKTHDIAGPMVKSAKDLWVLFNAISDKKFKKPDFTKNDLTGIKIGVIINEEIQNTFRSSDDYFLENIKNKFIKKGACVEKIELDKNIFSYDISDVLSYEFKREINKFLKLNFEHNKINTLEKIIEFNKEDLKSNAPFGQDLLIKSFQNDFDLKNIEKQIHEYQRKTSAIFRAAFQKYDFLLTISNYMTTPYACSGHPAINFPAGLRKSGEPVGGTLIADKYKESNLIETIHAYLS
jgi:amidase